MNAIALRRQTFTPTRIVTLIGIGLAASLLGDITLYVVLPTHTAQAGILLTDVGLMLSANRLIRIFLNSPYGIFIERMPRRPILITSLIIGALSSLLYTIPGFWPLLVGRLIWGIAWAGIWIGGSTIALDVATPTTRGRIVGRFQMWGFIGMGSSALLGGILTDQLGYHAAFIMSALITLLMALVWWLFLPETRPQQHYKVETIDTTTVTAHNPAQAVSRVGMITAIALLGVNWLIFMGIYGSVLALLLQERVGVGVALVGIFLPLSTLTGIIATGKELFSLICSPLAGWYSDHRGERWLLIIASLLLGVVALAMTSLGEGLVVIVAALLSGIVTGVLQTQVITLVGDYARVNRQGRVLGVVSTAGDIGSAAAPLLAYNVLLPLNVGIVGVFTLSALVLIPFLFWSIFVAWREKQQFIVSTEAL